MRTIFEDEEQCMMHSSPIGIPAPVNLYRADCYHILSRAAGKGWGGDTFRYAICEPQSVDETLRDPVPSLALRV